MGKGGDKRGAQRDKDSIRKVLNLILAVEQVCVY